MLQEFIIVNEKRGHDFEREQAVYFEMIWKQEKERNNIILSSKINEKHEEEALWIIRSIA